MVRIPDIHSDPSVEFFDSFRRASHLMAVNVGKSGKEFDRIAFIPNGGGIVLTLVADSLGFSGLDTIDMHIERNPNHPHSSNVEFNLGRQPDREEVDDMNILLIGDVWRTGGVLRRAAKSLRSLGAEMVEIAVAYQRNDKLVGDYRPDYYGVEAHGGLKLEWHLPPQAFEPITPVRRLEIPVDNPPILGA